MDNEVLLLKIIQESKVLQQKIHQLYPTWPRMIMDVMLVYTLLVESTLHCILGV